MITVACSLLAVFAAVRMGAFGPVPPPWGPTAAQATAEARRRLPQRPPVPGERVVLIRKADRVLALYRDGHLAAVYPVALGLRNQGHKEREGDGRTPEGTYYICTRNENSGFHLFLGLSYPSDTDAEAGYQAGRVTKAQRDAIVAAVRARQRPPWDTPLGGEVGIHGGGTGIDWTAGCVAMENQAVEELWAVLKLGDPVVIQP